jgi:hypothetical protein
MMGLFSTNGAGVSQGRQDEGTCVIAKSYKERIDHDARAVLVGYQGSDDFGPGRTSADQLGIRVEDRRRVALGKTVK